MNGPASSIFPDQAGATSHGPTPALAQEDVAQMVRVVGVVSVRASVVDLVSKAFQAGWWIGDDGSVVESRADRGLDSVLPAAATTLSDLAQASVGQTLSRKLSPRRWVSAWRIDAGRAIVAEVQFRDRRDALAEIDTAVIRLVCNASIRSALATSAAAALAGAADSAPLLVWPQVERRANKAPARSTRALWVVLSLAALFSAWVALVAAPGARQALATQQAENAQLRRTTDATLAQWLSTAMATGDYGETQVELSMFSSLGYFQGALVTNAKGKVVAMAGDVPGARIGDAVDPAFAAAARTQGLTLGSVQHGRLLIVTTTVPAPESLLGLRVTAAVAMLAVLAAAVIAALPPLLRRWRSR